MDLYAIASEMFTIKVSVMVMIGLFIVWHLINNKRHNDTERKAKDHEMRIVKMESWPSHEERIKKLEAQCEHQRQQLEALRTNAFTGATLKQVQ